MMSSYASSKFGITRGGLERSAIIGRMKNLAWFLLAAASEIAGCYAV